MNKTQRLQYLGDLLIKKFKISEEEINGPFIHDNVMYCWAKIIRWDGEFSKRTLFEPEVTPYPIFTAAVENLLGWMKGHNINYCDNDLLTVEDIYQETNQTRITFFTNKLYTNDINKLIKTIKTIK